LLVPRPSSTVVDSSITFEKFSRCFAPFSTTLWLAILGVSLLVGILQSYVRYRLEGAEAPKDSVDGRGRFMLLRKVWTGIAEALGEILSGGVGLDVDQVTTTGGRLLYLGWGFFVLIVISSYNALLCHSCKSGCVPHADELAGKLPELAVGN
ncbi:MAG: hypothetical protein SGPRY_007169, partial [Prymnesium sp.]